jgi:poly [ADP-ribose] polymerase 10/14/15
MANLIPVSLSDPKFDEIAGRVHVSFPNSCILWIDKISNTELENAHEILFENIRKNRENAKIEKLELFHGTTEFSAKIICEEGFKKELNKTSAFGKGTYFAKDASYSFSYSTKESLGNEIVYMLLCSVIVGKCIIGFTNMEIDTLEADNTINKLENPTIFVTPYDKGGIPKYLIAFHKYPDGNSYYYEM